MPWYHEAEIEIDVIWPGERLGIGGFGVDRGNFFLFDITRFQVGGEHFLFCFGRAVAEFAA